MGNDLGTRLWPNKYLSSGGDWLTSESGIYTAKMGNDGFFRVYAENQEIGKFGELGEKGMYHANLDHNGILYIFKESKYHWNSLVCLPPSLGKLFKDSMSFVNKYVDEYKKKVRPERPVIVLQDDGRLVTYSDGPGGPPVLWESPTSDPVEEIIKISKIEYDTKNILLEPPKTVVVGTKRVENATRNDQKYIIDCKGSVSTSRMWSDTVGLKVSSTVSVSAPFVGGSISVEGSYEYTRGETVTEENIMSDTLEMTVLPKKRLTVELMTQTHELEKVSYTYIGQVRLKSGRIVDNYKGSGVYKGTNLSKTTFFRTIEEDLETDDVVKRTIVP